MLDVIVNGVAYPLDDGTYCYLTGDDGWGMAQLKRLTRSGPLQHGHTDLGFRLSPRSASLALWIEGTTLQDLYDKREQLLGIFAPADDPVSLRWTLDSARQIDCHFASDMTMPSSSRNGFNQELVITFFCPDPTFYNPAGVARSFGMGGGGDTLTVPMSVPMTVGASTLYSIVNINYPGSWLSYPHLIRITGPITNPVITNTTTNEKLDFTGTTIAGGTYYDIDLRYGYKTVENNSGTNKIADLTADSDLATWHIAAAPEVPNGDNSITVTGTSATQATNVEISYYIRYLGR